MNRHAVQLARLAQLAYEPGPVADADGYSAHEIVALVQYLADGREITAQARARVHLGPQNAIVAFAGTDDIGDVALDLDAASIPVHAGQAHRGAWHYWLAVRRDVYGILHLLNARRPVHFIGHSLGGTAATLAAYDYATSHHGPLPDLSRALVSVTTFGAFRPGDSTLARAIDQRVRVVRYCNGPDPVTWYPSVLAGWRHPGRIIQLNEGAALLGPLAWIKDIFGFRLHFHPISAYLAALGGAE